MRSSAIFAIFVTIGIVLSLLFETLRFFESVNVFDFLFGLHWSPQMAIRADQVGSSGSFGAVPVFTGTLLISFIAMAVAGPIGMWPPSSQTGLASMFVQVLPASRLERGIEAPAQRYAPRAHIQTLVVWPKAAPIQATLRSCAVLVAVTAIRTTSA